MMESYCFTISLYHNVNRTTPLPHLRLRPHWSRARWKMCPWSALSSILGGPRKDMISCWNWILRKHIQYIYNTLQQTHKHGAERYLPRLAHDCRVWEHQVSPPKTRTDSGMGFIDLWGVSISPWYGLKSTFQGCIQPIQPIQPMEPKERGRGSDCGGFGPATCGVRGADSGSMLTKRRVFMMWVWLNPECIFVGCENTENHLFFFGIPSSIPQNNIPSSKVQWIFLEPAESASVLKHSPQFMSRQVPDPEDPAAEQVGCCISDFETFHIWVDCTVQRCPQFVVHNKHLWPRRVVRKMRKSRTPSDFNRSSGQAESRPTDSPRPRCSRWAVVSGHTGSNRGWYGLIPSQTEIMIWYDRVWYGSVSKPCTPGEHQNSW